MRGPAVLNPRYFYQLLFYYLKRLRPLEFEITYIIFLQNVWNTSPSK